MNLYQQGLKYLLHTLKYTPNPALKKQLQERHVGIASMCLFAPVRILHLPHFKCCFPQSAPLNVFTINITSRFVLVYYLLDVRAT